MAHNTRIRTSGNWVDELPPSDCLLLDTLQFQALSKRGGAWAPTSPIEIAGSQGLEVTGPSWFDQVTGLDLASAVPITYGSYTIEREHLSSPGCGRDFAVRGIIFGLDSGIFIGSLDAPVLVQTVADVVPTTTPRWWIHLALPVGCVLTKLSVTLRAAFAHNADDALPATMPRIALSRVAHDSPNYGWGDTPTFDSSDTMEAYRAPHTIELTDIPSGTYDGTQIWRAVIDGEYGVGSKPGLYVSSVRTTVTQTAHDEHQP
jgi:hypothetical protein